MEEKDEFDECPFCRSTDIDYSEVDGIWTCNYCWEIWDKEEII